MTSDILMPMGFLLCILVGMLVFSQTGSVRIPSTHETSLRLYATTFAVVGLCFASAHVSVLLVLTCFWVKCSVIAVLCAFLCLCPLVFFLVGCTILYRRRVLRIIGECLDDISLSSTQTDILQFADRLHSEMCISTPVKVLFHPSEHMSPVAVGKIRNASYLILPQNIQDLLLQACNRDANLAQGMLRLVLAHEMSHIRNRDVFFLPVLFSAQGPVFYAFLAFLPVFLPVLLLHPDENLRLILSPTVRFALVGVPFLKWVLGSTMRERERLADATATLFTAPDTVARLTAAPVGPVETPSYLERFVFFLRSQSSFSLSFLGFEIPRIRRSGLPRILTKIRGETLRGFRQRAQERLSLLESKGIIAWSGLTPSPMSAVITGLLGAFLLAIIFLTIQCAFIQSLILNHKPGGANILDGYLRGMEVWNATKNKNLPLVLFHYSTTLSISLVMAFLLLLPLRERVNRLQNVGLQDVFRLSALSGLAILTFSLAFGVFKESTRPSYPFLFRGIDLSGAPVALCAIPVMLLLATSMTLRRFFALPRYKRLAQESLVGLGWCGACVGAAIVLLQGLPLWGRILLGFNAILLASSLGHLQVFRPFFFYHEYWDERLVCFRWFGRQRLIPCAFPAKQSRLPKVLCGPNAFFFATFFLPALLLVMAAYPLLHQLDTYYVEHYESLKTLHKTLTAEAFDRIRENKLKFALEYFPLSIVNYNFQSERLLPSIAVGAVMLAILLVVSLLITAVIGVRGAQKHDGRLLNLLRVQELNELLDLSAISISITAPLSKELTAIRPKRKPFLAGLGGVPLMRQTCEAITCAWSQGLRLATMEGILRWISQCQCPGGGFAAAPGLEADLLHTRYGLPVLRRCDIVPEPPRESNHCAWLMDSLRSLLSRQHFLTESYRLEYLRLWVESACLVFDVKNIAQEQQQLIHDVSVLYWRVSTKSCRDTRNVLRILDCLGTLDDEFRSEIHSFWLPKHEVLLSTLQPLSDLANTVDLVWVLRLLYPCNYHQRESIVQLKDNIVKSHGRKSTLVSEVSARIQGWKGKK